MEKQTAKLPFENIEAACAGIADPADMVDCLRAVEAWILDYVPDDIGGRSHHLADVRAILNNTPRPLSFLPT